MRKISAGLLLFFFAVILASAGDSGHERVIERIIRSQENAWNKGDLDGFMSAYWKSDELTFLSGKSLVSGWDVLYARYEKKYFSGVSSRLSFRDLDIRVHNGMTAHVTGRWQVEMDGEISDGMFTIIFKKFTEGWKIIHDHSS